MRTVSHTHGRRDRSVRCTYVVCVCLCACVRARVASAPTQSRTSRRRRAQPHSARERRGDRGASQTPCWTWRSAATRCHCWLSAAKCCPQLDCRARQKALRVCVCVCACVTRTCCWVAAAARGRAIAFLTETWSVRCSAVRCAPVSGAKTRRGRTSFPVRAQRRPSLQARAEWLTASAAQKCLRTLRERTTIDTRCLTCDTQNRPTTYDTQHKGRATHEAWRPVATAQCSAHRSARRVRA